MSCGLGPLDIPKEKEIKNEVKKLENDVINKTIDVYTNSPIKNLEIEILRENEKQKDLTTKISNLKKELKEERKQYCFGKSKNGSKTSIKNLKEEITKENENLCKNMEKISKLKKELKEKKFYWKYHSDLFELRQMETKLSNLKTFLNDESEQKL